MGSLDGKYWPFTAYPLYSQMAPCMRSCNGDYSYNGCDNAACWCNKGNLDLRIATITRCASTSCTFANMNTVTDVSILSGIQVQYCVDQNHSPSGMTVPSEAESATTESGVQSTGVVPVGTGTGTGTDMASRTRVTSGPSATGTTNPATTSSSTSASSSSSSGLNTAAKAGIAVGAAFCVLLAIAIILLLRRRKHHPPVYIPPPNSNPNFQQQPNGPPMAPTPYSGHGPYSPPPLQHPVPQAIGNAAFAGSKGDVSPIEEKAAMAGITRKEVGGKRDISPQSSPPPKSVQLASPTPLSATTTLHDNGRREVLGSMPPPRHEAPNDGEITRPPPVNQYPGQQGYQESRQGQWGYGVGYAGQGGQGGAYEVDGGQSRQELAGQQHGGGRMGYGGQGGTYELGTGR